MEMNKSHENENHFDLVNLKKKYQFKISKMKVSLQAEWAAKVEALEIKNHELEAQVEAL